MACGLQAFFWVGYVSPFREGVLLRMDDPGVVPGAVSHADAALDADSDVVLETPPDADAYADAYILAALPAWDSFQVYHDNEMVDDALFDQDKRRVHGGWATIASFVVYYAIGILCQN
eukprot:scaffold114527_cov75-Attheya_sp.AAC.1